MIKRCQPPNLDWAAPAKTLPPGVCDCHAHIFGPFNKFPLSDKRGYTPHECTVETYMEMQAALGIERAVIVQGSAHGNNNEVTLDAVRKLGFRGKGIALVSPKVTDKELETLNSGGICGVRFSTISKAGYSINFLQEMASRVQKLGWLIQLHFGSVDEVIELVPILSRLRVKFLIDHQGRPPPSKGTDSRGFQALLELLKNSENCWVKICSWYRQSNIGFPYDDMRPFVDALISARHQHLVWGSNWPHPNFQGIMPNDTELLDQIIKWLGSSKKTQQILVDNPAKLYGFS